MCHPFPSQVLRHTAAHGCPHPSCPISPPYPFPSPPPPFPHSRGSMDRAVPAGCRLPPVPGKKALPVVPHKAPFEPRVAAGGGPCGWGWRVAAEGLCERHSRCQESHYSPWLTALQGWSPSSHPATARRDLGAEGAAPRGWRTPRELPESQTSRGRSPLPGFAQAGRAGQELSRGRAQLIPNAPLSLSVLVEGISTRQELECGSASQPGWAR